MDGDRIVRKRNQERPIRCGPHGKRLAIGARDPERVEERAHARLALIARADLERAPLISPIRDGDLSLSGLDPLAHLAWLARSPDGQPFRKALRAGKLFEQRVEFGPRQVDRAAYGVHHGKGRRDEETTGGDHDDDARFLSSRFFDPEGEARRQGHRPGYGSQGQPAPRKLNRAQLRDYSPERPAQWRRHEEREDDEHLDGLEETGSS